MYTERLSSEKRFFELFRCFVAEKHWSCLQFNYNWFRILTTCSKTLKNVQNETDPIEFDSRMNEMIQLLGYDAKRGNDLRTFWPSRADFGLKLSIAPSWGVFRQSWTIFRNEIIYNNLKSL